MFKVYVCAAVAVQLFVYAAAIGKACAKADEEKHGLNVFSTVAGCCLTLAATAPIHYAAIRYAFGV